MKFIQKKWIKGDPIKHEDLNRMEIGIAAALEKEKPIPVSTLKEKATNADAVKKINEIISVLKKNDLIT